MSDYEQHCDDYEHVEYSLILAGLGKCDECKRPLMWMKSASYENGKQYCANCANKIDDTEQESEQS